MWRWTFTKKEFNCASMCMCVHRFYFDEKKMFSMGPKWGIKENVWMRKLKAFNPVFISFPFTFRYKSQYFCYSIVHTLIYFLIRFRKTDVFSDIICFFLLMIITIVIIFIVEMFFLHFLLHFKHIVPSNLLWWQFFVRFDWVGTSTRMCIFLPTHR